MAGGRGSEESSRSPVKGTGAVYEPPLRESGGFLQTIIDAILEPMTVVGRDYRVVMANRAAREAAGMDPVAHSPTCHQAFHDRDRPCAEYGEACPLEQVIATKAPATVRRISPRGDGDEAFVEISAVPVFDQAGEVAQIIELSRDVTEQVRSERAIEGLAKFPSENPHPVMRVGADGTVLYMNAACDPVLTDRGCRLAEPVPDQWGKLVANVLKSGSVETVELEHGGRFFSFRVVPLSDAAYVNWYGRDITDARRATEALRESEERFRLLVANVTDYAIFMLDPEGNVVSWNQGGEQIKGYREKEILGKHFSVLYPPEDREAGKPEEELKTAIAEGRFEGEGWRVRKDGSRFWAHAVITPLRDEAGELRGFTEVTRDVTVRRQAERVREHLITELEAKNAELERFTYTVSHDLKGPLITIRGFLGQLRRDAAESDPERVEHDIQRIGNAAARMQELLEDLLDLSRIGRIVNPPTEVALGELAREAVGLLAGKIEQEGVRVEIASDLPAVFGDRTRVLEVLQNLIENAVKFTGDRPDPRVEVGARRESGETVCYVRDNGAGIDPRYHEKVFDLFGQLDPDSEGTGVGLAIVKRIVELHEGRVWVESDGEGRGSTFCFTLPEERKVREDG